MSSPYTTFDPLLPQAAADDMVRLCETFGTYRTYAEEPTFRGLGQAPRFGHGNEIAQVPKLHEPCLTGIAGGYAKSLSSRRSSNISAISRKAGLPRSYGRTHWIKCYQRAGRCSRANGSTRPAIASVSGGKRDCSK